MKTQLLVLALMTCIFATQIQAQNRTIVNTNSSEISDNLDLRVVASVFGDSKNLQDFESRLNDPKLQISNLDLNSDNQVDYLRVIESVENRTHVVIIQSVLDRDVYQDVATIEVEKDHYNKVQIQVVGNTYMYGANYIYEPVYYTTPVIYASFWLSNYRPYYSSWSWNYYPSYYYAWNPYPVYRYRYNVNNCLNTHYSYNNYNYVNYRRSICAVNIYNSRRSYGYEKQYPNYSFERRNSNVNNRYELEQRRNTKTVGYSQNRNEYQKVSTQKDYSQKDYSQKDYSQKDYSQKRNEYQRVANQQRSEPQRNYSQNRNEYQRVVTQQRNEPQKNYSQSRNEYQKIATQQRTESRNDNFSSRNSASREKNNSSRSSNRRS